MIGNYTHGIFRYSMQLLDEIPMVWSSCAFIYCQHMVKSRWEPSGPSQGVFFGVVRRVVWYWKVVYWLVWWEGCSDENCQLRVICRSGEKGLGVAALLATYGTLFTILYLAWPHPILHQVYHSVWIQVMVNSFICRWCMGCWCSTWSIKLWWYS